MAALTQSDDAALLEWATEALAKATGVRGEADIARHLLAQTTMGPLMVMTAAQLSLLQPTLAR